MVNPSAVLPTLKQTTSTQDIQAGLDFLSDHDLATLDELEVQHAKSWLTKLMKLSEDEETLDKAATLLQCLSGAKSGDDILSTYTFSSPLSEKPIDIHVRSTHMNSVDATGFCTWSSGKLLASMLLAEPQSYFGTGRTAPLRILELGSGTGLAGVAASKACELLQIQGEVLFTDYDATTLAILQENVTSNLTDSLSVRPVVRKLDWRDYLGSDKAEEPFDVILGADIVYEREHGKMVVSVVRKLLRKDGVFHLVIPLRHTHVADVEAFEKELRVVGLRISEVRELDKGEGQYPHRYYRVTS